MDDRDQAFTRCLSNTTEELVGQTLFKQGGSDAHDIFGLLQIIVESRLFNLGFTYDILLE